MLVKHVTITRIVYRKYVCIQSVYIEWVKHNFSSTQDDIQVKSISLHADVSLLSRLGRKYKPWYSFFNLLQPFFLTATLYSGYALIFPIKKRKIPFTMKLRDVIIDKDLTIEMLFYKHVDDNFSLDMKIIFIFHLQVPNNARNR